MRVLLFASATASSLAAQPLEQIEGAAFGLTVTLAAKSDSPRLRDHLEGALAEIRRTETDARALESRLGTTDGAPATLALGEFELLARALGVCRWSEGVVNPAAGRVYELVGLRQPVPSWPTQEQLEAVTGALSCEKLELNPRLRTARLASAARLELFPFEAGWAVDRAASLLRAAAIHDFSIRLGGTVRAEGGGPDGRGWPFEVAPQVVSWGLDTFRLRDRAATVLIRDDPPLQVSGLLQVPYLDLRFGKPPTGVLAVGVITAEAVEARAIAQVMFALGATRGQLLVGALPTAASILWLLGSGEGTALRVEAGWSRGIRR